MNNLSYKEILTKYRREIEDKLKIIGEVVEGEAKLNISGHNDKWMRAVDTGRLMNSIIHKVIKKDLKVRIGTNVEYAPHVEFGTKIMPPRPFLRQAFIESKPEIRKILRNK